MRRSHSSTFPRTLRFACALAFAACGPQRGIEALEATARSSTAAPRPPLEGEARRALVEGRHADPHAFLGPRVDEGSSETAVRALFPDAASVTAVYRAASGDETSVALTATGDGIFEGVIPLAPVTYRYEVTSSDGSGVRRVEDAYRFGPTVSSAAIARFRQGDDFDAADLLGPHARIIDGVRGYAFAVWAPNAQGVSVVGDFNGWRETAHMMRRIDGAVFEVFVPEAHPGDVYQLSVLGQDGQRVRKSDPAGRFHQLRPGTSSILFESHFDWSDGDFMDQRASRNALGEPLSIYEVHLPSWKRRLDGSMLSYRELGLELAPYLTAHGFNAVELMAISEHPLDDSWGYQVTGYYAPTSRLGTPDDLKCFVELMHLANIRVIFDWVPAHFPKDAHGLARFDGTHLFDDPDPRRGEHPDWGTYVFNYEKPEVRSFLLGGLAHMMREYHLDGARVDAVASMLYLDYSRSEWIPNAMGGRENLDAVAFLREANHAVHTNIPGALMIAEESTAWPGVTSTMGSLSLGFDLKWNMGWMHDTLDFFSTPVGARPGTLERLTHTFSWLWSERYVLALSHDEVVHLKRSLLEKMPGSDDEKLANLRLLFAYMTSYPGAKLLFMGAELGQPGEWDFHTQIDWSQLANPGHVGLGRALRDLNALTAEKSALHEASYDPSAFELTARDPYTAVVAMKRSAPSGSPPVLFVHNFTTVHHPSYRIGVDGPGRYVQIFNSDLAIYGGRDRGAIAHVDAEPISAFDKPYSIELELPPLTSVAFEPEASR